MESQVSLGSEHWVVVQTQTTRPPLLPKHKEIVRSREKKSKIRHTTTTMKYPSN